MIWGFRCVFSIGRVFPIIQIIQIIPITSIILFFFLNNAAYNTAYALNYQTLNKTLNDPVFDLEGFINNLNDMEVPQTLESTLVELKKAEPSFFNKYVLMYKSRSLQTSSFMFPRVLLNAPNSTTVISYNGNPEDHGYEKFEVMRFNPQTAKFIFNEINFSNGKLNLSADNPQKCMNCHQNSSRTVNDPRPNWEPYSIWPGAYSSIAVSGRNFFKPSSPKYDPILTHDAQIENKMYEFFLKKVASRHPRYKLLRPMGFGYAGDYFPALGTPKGAPNRFTTTMTDQFLNLNVLRIARLIKNTEILVDYKQVVYALATCRKIYLPDKIFNWHKKHIHSELKEHIELEEFAQAIELIFEPYNISTQDWSMDFGTGAKFAFRHRFGGPKNFKASFKRALEIRMPELKGQKCIEMKEKIKAHSFIETQALRDQIDSGKKEKKSRPLISRCTSCHTTSAFNAPFIPFDNELKLSQALKNQGYPRGTLKEEIFYRVGVHAQFFERMPADGSLPKTDEVEALKAYLNGL